jgi:ribosomal-protein-alanine N-acetyltransferase
MPDQDGVTMVGYFLDKKYRQKGFASEALKTLIDWAATDFSLKTIIADTPVDNLASQNVLIKQGFKEFGLIEEVKHIENLKVKHWRLDLKK